METRKDNNTNDINDSCKKEEEDQLSALPLDLLKANNNTGSSIGNYLSLQDLKNLALVKNKKLFSIFKPNIKPANLIRKFLLHVVLGEKEQVEEMLKCELGLLLEKDTVKDEAGRLICGTALQIALGAKDVSIRKHEEMVEMIERYLRQLPDGELKISEQIAEQFPKGYEKQEEERRKCDWQALQKVFASIENSNTDQDQDCEKAIEEFKNHLKKQTEKVIKAGFHFNDQLFAKALELYDSHYDQFGGVNSRKNNLAAIKVLGNIECYFPACLAMAACHGFGAGTVVEGKKLSRSKLLGDGTPFYHPNLGVSHFVYSHFGVPSRAGFAPGSLSFLSVWLFFQLFSSKSFKLAEIISHALERKQRLGS